MRIAMYSIYTYTYTTPLMYYNVVYGGYERKLELYICP